MARPRSGTRSGKAGTRQLKTRVATAKGRKLSSTRWLQRQLNDPYVTAARQQGYRSRAAFKLLEIDERYQILPQDGLIIDLGAAPGGWSQIAARSAPPTASAAAAAEQPAPRVIAIDLQPLEPIPGVTIIEGDFLEPATYDQLITAIADRKVMAVLSDMAAPATGHKQTDHLRIIGLCEAALDFAEQWLHPGGCFLAKVLQGGSTHEILTRLKQGFSKVRHVKPDASRKGSSELYVLATGFQNADQRR